MTKRIKITSRSQEIRIIPIGDIHLGAAACDEDLLDRVIESVKDKNTYWIGLGDYCDFINRKDPRYSLSSEAEWLHGVSDKAKAQKEYFLEKFRPIAHKCLAMLEGNHESTILRHYERDIYSELVTGIKEAGKFAPEEQLAIGYYGWLRLVFERKTKNKKSPSKKIIINLHHGFTGGKLAGGKALNMQRWLWNHDCDLAIFGHSHNTAAQPEAVEKLDGNGNWFTQIRKGAYGGTFLKTVNEGGSSTYSEVKGYFPLPMKGVEIIIRPHAATPEDRVRIIL